MPNPIIETLADLNRESNRIKDQIDKDVSDAKLEMRALEKKSVALGAKIKSLDVDFKAEYEKRFKVLEDKEQRCAENQNKADADRRVLDEKIKEFNSLKNKRDSEKKSLGKRIVEKEKLIDLRISGLDEEKEDVAEEKSTLVRIKNDLHKSIEQYKKERSLLDSEIKAVAKEKSFAQGLFLQAQEKLKSVDIKLEEVKRIQLSNKEDLKEIDIKIENIAALMSTLEKKAAEVAKKKADLVDSINDQEKNKRIIQEVSKRNHSERISLFAMKKVLDQKDIEIKERMKNLEILEAKVKV